MITRLYKLVDDLLTREEFYNRINEYKKTFNNLLDEEVIALLIVDELGRNTSNLLKIKDLQPGVTGTLIGKVLTITNNSRRATIELLDDTGVIPVIIWKSRENNVDQIQPTDTIRLINGYVKQNNGNKEFHIGRWSNIERIEITICKPIEELSGILQEINPTYVFIKNNGEYGFVTTIKIQVDKEGLTPIIVWDEHVKSIQRYKPGDYITIKNISLYKHMYGRELHITSQSTLN